MRDTRRRFVYVAVAVLAAGVAVAGIGNAIGARLDGSTEGSSALREVGNGAGATLVTATGPWSPPLTTNALGVTFTAGFLPGVTDEKTASGFEGFVIH